MSYTRTQSQVIMNKTVLFLHKGPVPKQKLEVTFVSQFGANFEIKFLIVYTILQYKRRRWLGRPPTDNF